jgi:hypothetical protein
MCLRDQKTRRFIMKQPFVSKHEVVDFKARLFLFITNLQLLLALYLVYAHRNYDL